MCIECVILLLNDWFVDGRVLKSDKISLQNVMFMQRSIINSPGNDRIIEEATKTPLEKLFVYEMKSVQWSKKLDVFESES